MRYSKSVKHYWNTLTIDSMVQYKLLRKDTGTFVARCDTKEEAVKAMEKAIADERLRSLYPFDFELKEDEVFSLAPKMPDYAEALSALGLSKLPAVLDDDKEESDIWRAAKAFYKLCVIAKVWNKRKGYSPTCNNGRLQYFIAGMLNFTSTKDCEPPMPAIGTLGAMGLVNNINLCFKTTDDAREFVRSNKGLFEQMIGYEDRK